MKIAINLLPPEIRAQELKRAKFYKIQFAGIVVILIMVFLSSLTVVLRILQSRNIIQAETKLAQAQQRVSDFKDTEASLFLLKNRLTVIDQFLGVSSEQSLMYKLMDKLIPPSVVVNGVGVDKAGDIVFLAMVPDSKGVDDLINNLISKENNEDKISDISIENLSRSREGFYRISLKIKSK